MLDPWLHATPEQVRAAILEREPRTRFTYAWGPLCRWPGLTPQQVREEVAKELFLLRRVLQDDAATYDAPPTELRREVTRF